MPHENFCCWTKRGIGQPLIAELIRQGHTVTGMSRSSAGAQKRVDLRASAAVVNAFDQLAVEQALRRAQAEVVIDQLTALPKDPSQMATAFPGDRKLRLEGRRKPSSCGAGSRRRALRPKSERLFPEGGPRACRRIYAAGDRGKPRRCRELSVPEISANVS